MKTPRHGFPRCETGARTRVKGRREPTQHQKQLIEKLPRRKRQHERAVVATAASPCRDTAAFEFRWPDPAAHHVYIRRMLSETEVKPTFSETLFEKL